jgi:hypothetical protein
MQVEQKQPKEMTETHEAYKGDTKDGQMHGEGVLYLNPGSEYPKYVGSFRNGMMCGIGELFLGKNKRIHGLFENVDVSTFK